MSRLRNLLVLLGLALLVVGTGFEVVTGREHWPLSPYAMFSQPLEADPETPGARRVRRLRLVGVTPARERVVLRSPGGFAPFEEGRLRTALRRTLDEPGRTPAALDALLERTEPGRFEGLRLEEWVWETTLDEPPAIRPLPDERLLLAVSGAASEERAP